MEDSILKLVLSWALARLGDRNTWATWIAIAAAHFGGVTNPAISPLLVNAALGLVALIGYVVKGTPIFEPKKEESK